MTDLTQRSLDELQAMTLGELAQVSSEELRRLTFDQLFATWEARRLRRIERNLARPRDKLTERPVLEVLAEDRALIARRSCYYDGIPLTLVPKEEWIIEPFDDRELSIRVGAHVDQTNHVFWTMVCLADLPNDLFGVADYELIRVSTGLDPAAIIEFVNSASIGGD